MPLRGLWHPQGLLRLMSVTVAHDEVRSREIVPDVLWLPKEGQRNRDGRVTSVYEVNELPKKRSKQHDSSDFS